MQVLYVAGFEIAAAEDAPAEPDPAAVLLELLGEWIGGQTDAPVPASELRASGERELSRAHGANRRHAVWEHVRGEDQWATRVERRDVAMDGGVFITRVTIGDGPDGLSVRVSMARDVPNAGLTPTSPPILRQPAFVAAIAENPRLDVRVDDQVQDGRYLQVRSPQEVALLAEALRKSARLPILLLHTRTLKARAAARTAASRLIGLARVVTLDYRAARALRELVPEIDVPYAGGLLVWADLAASPTVLSSADVNEADPDVLRASLMARIAPLSVLTRGDDDAYRRTRAAARALESARAAQRTAEAEGTGDSEAQIRALREELTVAQSELEYFSDEYDKAEELAAARAKEVAVLQTQVDQLRAQVEQLNVAATYRPQELAAAEVETFDNAPELKVADGESLEAVAQHLERVSAGRIVFTPKATIAWRKATRYATPDEMRDGLVKLAKVSHDIHDGQERAMGHFDTWVRENYDLRISMHDEAMPKKFRKFLFDGELYDRTPHVKVNDGVPPHECGRVYFTIDKPNSRVIVDHVGLHW